jgi:hypothetical protein
MELPIEIIEIIISFVPIKNRAKMREICQIWKVIIDNPRSWKDLTIKSINIHTYCSVDTILWIREYTRIFDIDKITGKSLESKNAEIVEWCMKYYIRYYETTKSLDKKRIEMLFDAACISGLIIYAKKLLHEYNDKGCYIVQSCWYFICKSCNYDDLKWFINHAKHFSHSDIFIAACMCNKIDIAERLLNEYNNIENAVKIMFWALSIGDIIESGGNHETIIWFLERFGLYDFDSSDIRSFIDTIIEFAELKTIIYFVDYFKIATVCVVDDWLRSICYYPKSNKFEKFKYICENLGVTKDHIKRQSLLVSICYAGMEFVDYVVKRFKLSRSEIIMGLDGIIPICSIKVMRWVILKYRVKNITSDQLIRSFNECYKSELSAKKLKWIFGRLMYIYPRNSTSCLEVFNKYMILSFGWRLRN